MTGKDFLVVILMVIVFYVVTFFMWTHYKDIAQMFFAGLLICAMGLFAYGSWHVLGCGTRS